MRASALVHLRTVAAVSGAAILLVSCSDGPAIPSFGPGPTTAYSLSSAFDDYIFLPWVCDDGGTNDVPEQSDLNCFSRADNVGGSVAVKWNWDDIDAWTGGGQTGDACALFDTGTNGNADFAVCARISNSPDGSQVFQLGPGQSPLLWQCSDKKNDRCSKPTAPLALAGTYCEAALDNAEIPLDGDHAPNNVLAGCIVPLSAVGGAGSASLLNVCSYPSGEPNSNPFDCVITPGAGYIQLVKTTDPDPTLAEFDFTLSPGSTDGTTAFGRVGAGNVALIPVLPGTSYTITETVPTNWQLDSAACVGQTDGSSSLSGSALSGIKVTTGQTITCTFDNSQKPPTIKVTKTAQSATVSELGGDVTYDVLVENTTPAPVTLNSLVDDKFGSLAGQGSCSLSQSLDAAGGANDSYMCSFTGTLPADAPDAIHVNEVTAQASNAGGNATAKDTAKVTYTDQLPSITVVKTANPTSVPETGGDVTYTVKVTNTVGEPLTLTTLSDDQFGDLTAAGSSTCTLPQSLDAAGGANDEYTCSFTESVSGNAGGSHVNTVTATATDDDGNSDDDTDDATVTFSDVLPSISVDKTANPTSVPESGGLVTYTVVVTNLSTEGVSLTTLSDDQFGDLTAAGSSTCVLPQALDPAGGANDDYTCTFQETVSGAAGGSHVNTVTATASDDDGNQDQDDDDATVTFSDVQPEITVDKTANPTTVPETGGDVTYTVVVTNTVSVPVTLTTLSDDQFGDLTAAGSSTCVLPQTLDAAGGANDDYTCSFTESLSGEAGGTHVNTVTATATDDDGNSDQDDDDATVTFTDVLPSISVDKSANPTSVPESGGSVTYTVVVTNLSTEGVSLTTLSDDQFGDLTAAGSSTCVLPQALDPAGGANDDYTCTFQETVSGAAGGSHVNTVTATASDNDGNQDQDDDDATVTFSDVQPEITVDKTANPTSVPETGGDVTYTVKVTNTVSVPLTLTTLSDDQFGDLTAAGSSTCTLPQSLDAAGGANDDYTCSFTESVSGNVGVDHVNTVTATATDDDGNSDDDTDDATVSFTDVAPDIEVTKTVDPTQLPEVVVTTAGGPMLTSHDLGEGSPLLSIVTPQDLETFYFPTPVCDDAGPNDEPEQSDVNCLTRADNNPGYLVVQWSWDDINAWGGGGQTGDACALFDTNGNGFANYAVCSRITNDAQGDVVLVEGGAALGYTCSDKRTDRCSQPLGAMLDFSQTFCIIGNVDEAFPGDGDDGSDTAASCFVKLSEVGGASSADVINVCSYPSGSPNSNAFDCVLTAGTGFIEVNKVTDIASGALQFPFTISPAGSDGTTSFNVVSGGSALIPVAPGSSPFTVTENAPTNWTLDSATCESGSFDATNDRVTGITVGQGQTVECTFTNSWAFSGPVTYTVVVENKTAEAVDLTVLDDDKFGSVWSITGVTCDSSPVGGKVALAGLATYTCTFVKTLTGADGDTHTNTVTATANDDEGGSDTDTDSATVTFVFPSSE